MKNTLKTLYLSFALFTYSVPSSFAAISDYMYKDLDSFSGIYVGYGVDFNRTSIDHYGNYSSSGYHFSDTNLNLKQSFFLGYGKIMEGNLYFGLELGKTMTGIDESFTVGTNSYNYSYNPSFNIRARLGYAIEDKYLLYIFSGFDYASYNISRDGTTLFGNNGTMFGGGNSIYTTQGLGLDYALNSDFITRFEYGIMHIDNTLYHAISPMTMDRSQLDNETFRLGIVYRVA